MLLYVMPLLLMLSAIVTDVITVLSAIFSAITALHNISLTHHVYDPLHFYYLFTPLHTSVNLLTIPQPSQ